MRRKLPAKSKEVGAGSAYVDNIHHPVSPLSKEKIKVGLLVGSIIQTEQDFFSFDSG